MCDKYLIALKVYLYISNICDTEIMEQSKVQSFAAHTPALEELKDALQEGLRSYFKEVNVQLVACPDFTQKPYKIAVSGLHGKSTIADVGGGECWR